ncbi:APC family permease [Acetilactobacillus jinshanensis]|uniref:APC family permease n=1 Tax=Acetilactobacillus jinshanensis TaxID=1720083 RepID=A0A4P6ZL91_9LACO|nr:APC family permease [Acetilactobacillus jinshanensis]QBP18438.1 APC family permease [Acetilactobacillus jinshanensis]URL61310.1 APC family permease [uncultured bacterium]
MTHTKGHKINALEAFALSLATMAPTGSMAGNTGPGAKFAGVNLPLSFLIAAIAMLLVATGFYEMSKRVAADGSIYAYNRVALGEHWGFVSGWIIMLSYTVLSVAMAGQAGMYASLVLKNIGIQLSSAMCGFIILIIMLLILSHGIKLTSNISLVTEALAVTFLLVMSIIIIAKGGDQGITIKPFIPSTSFSGIGQGVVYTVLCFVGFEVVCTVATRCKEPKKAVPHALLATIFGGMAIFVFVSYAVVIGYGTGHIGTLAASQTPLNSLAVRFMGPEMAFVVDLAIFISCFGADLCVTNAAIYMYYALGEHHYLPKSLGVFNTKHNAPSHAVYTVLAISIVLYALVAFKFGAVNDYLYYVTLGALCMIVIYMLSCVGSFVFFRKHKDIKHSFIKHDFAPIVGFVVLVFPLISNIYPVPQFPLNLMPYAVLVWGVIGYFMSVHHTKSSYKSISSK